MISVSTLRWVTFFLQSNDKLSLGMGPGMKRNDPDLFPHMALKNISDLHSVSVTFLMASTAGQHNVAAFRLPGLLLCLFCSLA